MANTFTNLVADAYAALDVVSRELVGFIPAVRRDSTADRLAVGQTLRSPVAPINTAGGDITPAMAFPAAAYQTISNKSLTLTKQRYMPFSWTGEESYALNQGAGYLTVKQDQIAQAIRALVNEMESDLFVAAALGSSRAYGTAGTNPFATNLDPSSFTRQILDDNGAPTSDRHLIVSTSAGANQRNRTGGVLNANAAITADVLNLGVLIDVNGFKVRESAKVTTRTAGTGTSYLLNGALAVGDTTVTVDTGSGTILAGDVVTIGSDKYVVATALSGGTFTVNAPGIVTAAADNLAISVNATSTRNVAFTRNALLLATRLPITPAEGDLALMREVITDPVSGISFEIVAYPGIDMVTYHVRAVWGVLATKTEHIATMLG